MKKAVKISLICVVIFMCVSAALVGIFFMIIEPNVRIFGASDIDDAKLSSSHGVVTVLDVNGNVMDTPYGGMLAVEYDEVPTHTVNAFIAIEDKRFYSHHGVDYKRMAAALVSNIKSGGFREGASTITQQLIKNTHLSNKKTLRRKIDEIRLARKLERSYDKNKILECYFNILYFGSGIRGLGTASRVMFGKSVEDLSLAQSASLASIINNPSKYNPYTNYDNLMRRKILVLDRMLEQNFITRKDYAVACAEHVEFAKETKQSQFVAGLIKDACKELKCAEKELYIGNYTLKTAYDPKISEFVRGELKQITDSDARVYILDNASGGVVCDETNADGYINPLRSPASAIKPFLSYAPALENGMTPLSQILDEPTSFGGYAPSNYKGIYRGYLSLRDCLIYSSNIAAVKLVQDVGLDYAKSTAEKFGLNFSENDGSFAVALGGMDKGVTLPQIANAYRTLACGGKFSPAHYFKDIAKNGKIETPALYGNHVVSSDVAYLLTDMLTDCAKRGTAKKLKNCGVIAAKTGTNGDESGNYDCYSIAYTPRHTIAVWYGARNNTHIDNKITGAACCNIIKKLCDNGYIKTDKQFDMPSSVAYYDIDAKTLEETREVYLADPLLPQRYRRRELLSKRYLPIRKHIDMIDYYDEYYWDE